MPRLRTPAPPIARALAAALGLAVALPWLLSRDVTRRPLPSAGAPSAGAPSAGAPALGGLPAALDLGALGRGEVRHVTLPWVRTGDGSLRILGVRTDCGCVAVDVPRGVLDPGSRGALAVRITAGSRPGPFATRVRIHTEPPAPGGAIVCRLHGYVARPLVARPSALDLGRRTVGRALERAIELAWAPAGDPGPREALGLSAAGLEASARFEPPARGGEAGCLLRLTLRVPEAPGPFSGQVAVCRGRTVLVVVPVRGRAVAEGAGPRRPAK